MLAHAQEYAENAHGVTIDDLARMTSLPAVLVSSALHSLRTKFTHLGEYRTAVMFRAGQEVVQ